MSASETDRLLSYLQNPISPHEFSNALLALIDLRVKRALDSASASPPPSVGPASSRVSGRYVIVYDMNRVERGRFFVPHAEGELLLVQWGPYQEPS